MPIRTDLTISPYYDDYDITKQYHRVLFRPGYAVQARELSQLQTVLQNQVEQFGDNIFKEGSIIKGCNFTEISSLQYVKVADTGLDVRSYIGGMAIDEQTGKEYEIFYEIEGQESLLRALVVFATFGLETNDPDLSTFYINYLNTNVNQNKQFFQGETLKILRYEVRNEEGIGDVTSPAVEVAVIPVTERSNHVGKSFGIESGVGIVYQKGHFVFAKSQITILSKYDDVPNNVSVGYEVKESLISALNDNTLYDNSIGSPNFNAPGANRLKLEPILTVKTTAEADADPTFFTLSRYVNGVAVQVRDVSQYNVLGEEMARRTFEESGNYIVKGFKTKTITGANNALVAAVEAGTAYVKGYRVATKGEIFIEVDQLAQTDTEIQENQPVSVNYGSYVNISNNATLGTLPVGTYATANLMNGAAVIGTALVRNFTPDRVYLSNIRMANNTFSFSDVTAIKGAAGSVSITPVIRQKSDDTFVFSVGETFLKNVTDINIPVRKTRQLTGITDTIILNSESGEDFNVQLDDILIVDAVNDNLVISSVVQNTPTQITINLVPGQTPTANGTIYYNSRIRDLQPYSKLDKTLYVKATYSTSETRYSLGFADVYSIESILDSSGKNVTNSFRLKNNQKDHFYGLSYIEYIPGRTVPANGLMTITMKAFKIENSAGRYFFTVDSYPADLDLSYIPTYVTSSGSVLNLRDCLDFRPYATNTVSYTAAEVIGTAPTVTTQVGDNPTFTGSFLIPALNSAATADIEFFLNRTDSITIDSYGKFTVVKGKPEAKSKAPTINDDRLVISEVYVPGYPAIASSVAVQENKPELGIKVKSRGSKNYTMKDIGDLDQRVNNLIYYTTLSMIESSTQNLNITDENGLTRFKNGILVDPFNDLSIADVKNNEFNAALDFTEKSLTPSVRTIPINLKYSNSSNTSIHPSSVEIDAATLETTSNIPVITQPYATGFRNCVSNFYNYRGTGSVFPEYDGAFDTVTAPASNIEVDLVTPFVEYTEAIQEFMPLTSTSSTLVNSNRQVASNTTTTGNTRTTTTTTTTTNKFQDVVTSLQISESSNQQKVGEFVTNFNFIPFMRSREVLVLMHGLRPDTRHYFYFDGIDVNQHVVPGVVPESDSVRDVVPAGTTVASVITNSSGSLAAIFTIPAETFYVGDRVLLISDVDNINSVTSGGTSGGTLVYRAYNFALEKQEVTLTTRTPETENVSNTTTRTVVNRQVTRNSVNIGGGNDRGGRDPAPERGGKKDPLAQTFFIKTAMAQDADSIFASRIDVFFKRKSAVNGVTVMLREVVNGYPAPEILPFSKIHLKPTDVLISDDGSVATPVFFKAPVRLDVEKEYCVVIMPDAADPDYLAYTSKVGQTELGSGLAVVMDWGDGVLFTSTNNRAWQSYQDEDLKFTLYRRNFEKSEGTVTLTNDDHEFFTVSSITGDFENGERVFTTKTIVANTTSQTIGAQQGNTFITGTQLPSTYTVGDYIYIYNDSETSKDIFKVLESNSTTIKLNKPFKFATASYNARPAVVGNIVYYNQRSPDMMVLEKSSATATKFFAAGNSIRGFTSGAVATISSVDNIELSYMQPIILKTNNSATNTTMTGTFTNPSNTDSTYTMNVPFNDKTTFNNKGCVIFSKSNGAKPFNLNITMTNSNNSTATPFVDIETATLLAYQYKVTDTAATTSKYVSKTIELAENLDAEDFTLYATAYRPANTDVKIYIKAQNASDPYEFDLNDWIELEVVDGAQVYSSTSNLNDFKEFVYKVPDSAKTNGVLTYSNATGTYTGYRKFTIKIELVVNSVGGRIPIGSVPRLLDYRGIALT